MPAALVTLYLHVIRLSFTEGRTLGLIPFETGFIFSKFSVHDSVHYKSISIKVERDANYAV